MIDNFALAVSHLLILVAAIRLLGRPDLDDDSIPVPDPAVGTRSWGRPNPFGKRWGRRDA
jgi:hypothetical protein